MADAGRALSRLRRPYADFANSSNFSDLVFVLVLFRHVILRELTRPHFSLIGIWSILYAADGFGFHVLAFFHQFFHAFRIVIASA